MLLENRVYTIFCTPSLPLAPGVPERQSHDYERHGTTSLFAALDVASGIVISDCYRQHRHQEFLRFLRQIDDRVPQDLEVHMVLDNYGNHKVDKVRRWLIRHRRFHVHCTPAGGSWRNLVERLFAEVTERCVKRGSHWAVRDLESAIPAYLDQRTKIPNRLPGPPMPSSSWERSHDFANGFLVQDTSVQSQKLA